MRFEILSTGLLIVALAATGCASAGTSAPAAGGRQASHAVDDPGTAGAATGLVRLAGEPVAGCLVRLTLVRVAAGSPVVWAPGTIAEATTDEEGRFRFDGLPPGSYKLRWLLPGAAHWLRRLSPEPDFEIAAGELVEVVTIQAGRRAIGD